MATAGERLRTVLPAWQLAASVANPTRLCNPCICGSLRANSCPPDPGTPFVIGSLLKVRLEPLTTASTFA
jgi:hypothetical protein